MKITLKILSYTLLAFCALALFGLVLDPSGDATDAMIQLGLVGLLMAQGIMTLVYIDKRD